MQEITSGAGLVILRYVLLHQYIALSTRTEKPELVCAEVLWMRKPSSGRGMQSSRPREKNKAHGAGHHSRDAQLQPALNLGFRALNVLPRSGAVPSWHLSSSCETCNNARCVDASVEQPRPGELGQFHLRTWDLINKGSAFEELATNDYIFKVISLILGNDFVLGSMR